MLAPIRPPPSRFSCVPMPALPHLKRYAILLAILAGFAGITLLVNRREAWARSDPPWVYLLCLSLGSAALLGVWSALVSRPWWLRVPNGLLALLTVVAVYFWTIADWQSGFSQGLERVLFSAFYISSFLAAWATCTSLRWLRRWHLVPLEAVGQPVWRSPRQYQLGLLFFEIFLVAVLLGLMRAAPADYWQDLINFEFLVATGVIALALVPIQAPLVALLWLILVEPRPQRRNRWVVIGLSVVLLALCLATLGWFSDRWEQFTTLVQTVLLAYLGAVAALGALRLAGYRLVTSRSSLPAAPIPIVDQSDR